MPHYGNNCALKRIAVPIPARIRRRGLGADTRPRGAPRCIARAVVSAQPTAANQNAWIAAFRGE